MTATPHEYAVGDVVSVDITNFQFGIVFVDTPTWAPGTITDLVEFPGEPLQVWVQLHDEIRRWGEVIVTPDRIKKS